MKVVEIKETGGPEVMQLVEVETPEPGPKQVRVKVDACGLNYSDVMIRRGAYVEQMELPYRMGREFCGTIDAVGSEVAAYEAGQQVVGSTPGGAMGEYVVAPAAGLVPLPPGMAPEEGAAFLIQGITAMHCLDDCVQVKSGEKALVHAAAGGVGTMAVQIAVARGAKVIGTASTEEKCGVIRNLGGEAVRYTEGDWVAEVLRITDGKGADVILESVGGDVFWRSYREALAIFGRMVTFGVASGEIVSLTNRDVLVSNRSLVGYYLGSFFPHHLDRIATATAKLMALYQEGKIRPVVQQTYSLDQFADAMAALEGRKSIGKVIVKP